MGNISSSSRQPKTHPARTERVEDKKVLHQFEATDEVYSILDVKGRGILVDLMRKAILTRKGFQIDYSEIDDFIQNEIVKYLYNDGEGKFIEKSILVKMRRKERGDNGLSHDKEKEGESSTADEAPPGCALKDEFREVCWKVSCRGAVGETPLHLCLLNSTYIYREIAKRLLHYFPKLCLDIYQSDEFYGETALHFAIVNGDPAMVKLLLDKGSDANERCTGRFFAPDDLKTNRKDSWDHEWTDFDKVQSNYRGLTHWGEFPLSFAACLGQEECVRWLLNCKKPASPNMQDANGNTTMHMLVVHDGIKMFDVLYHEFKADIKIKNIAGFTPLTLAAHLGRKDMFQHILELQSETLWEYVDVRAAAYPLTEVDSLTPEGEVKIDRTESALRIVLESKESVHLDMLDGMLMHLLQVKWDIYVRGNFLFRVFLFLLMGISFATCFFLRPDHPKPGDKYDACYIYNATEGTLNIIRLILEVMTVTIVLLATLVQIRQLVKLGIYMFIWQVRELTNRFILFIFCVLITSAVPMRLACEPVGETIVINLAALCFAPSILFYCRGNRHLGPIVYMIGKMIRVDIARFLLIYVIFLMAFSQVMFILHSGDPVLNLPDSPFQQWYDAILQMYIMSLGEFEDIYQSLQGTINEYVGKMAFVFYMLFVTVLLINMLIAMMGNTYITVNETRKEWQRQWGKMVLIMEQELGDKNRKIHLLDYARPMVTVPGTYGLVLRNSTITKLDVSQTAHHKAIIFFGEDEARQRNKLRRKSSSGLMKKLGI